MSLVTVKYDGVPVPVNMPDALNDVCEHIATVKRGRFGVITGHQSGTAGKDKCVRPTISDITFITNPRYDRYLERMQAAVSAVYFMPFVSSLMQSQYNEMKTKNGGENLEPAFDAAKAEVLASLAESLEGDGGDAHRMGHRLCYATFDAGDVPVKCHLATEKGDDGHMRPIMESNGLMAVDSIMLPFFTVSRKVIDKGDWKETNSRLPTLLKDAIRKATGLPEWKALSLGKGNFRTLTLDKAKVYGLVAQPLSEIPAPQADFFAYIAGLADGFWSAIEALAEVVVHSSTNERR